MESLTPENQSLEDQSVEDRLGLARALLEPVRKQDAAWPALAATAFFAVCAMGFAVTAIMTPAHSYPPAPVESGDVEK